MSLLRFGILGTGHIAGKFMDAIPRATGATVVAAASRTPGKATAFAAEHAIPVAYDSYEELLADPAVEAVYVANTPNFHRDTLLACIAAGKAVLCEKPFVTTQAEADEVFAAAEKAGVFVMEALWSRFLPPTQKARDLIRTGAIGKVLHVDSNMNFRRTYNPEGRLFKKELAGGGLNDMGVYTLSIPAFLVGEYPDTIQSVSRPAPTGLDFHTCGVMRFPGGATGSFTCGMSFAKPNTLTVYGETGQLVLHADFQNTRQIDLIPDEGEPQTFVYTYENGFEYQIQETVRCIREGKQQSDIHSWEDTRRCCVLMDRCRDE